MHIFLASLYFLVERECCANYVYKKVFGEAISMTMMNLVVK
jgi:hypothetical protein